MNINRVTLQHNKEFIISVEQEAAKKSTELANHYGLLYNNPTPQVTLHFPVSHA